MKVKLTLKDIPNFCCLIEYCRKCLLNEDNIFEFHVGEIAHIHAKSDGGPRAKPELGIKDRQSRENLILLCPTCHTKVDKCPDQYPASLLREWKRNHRSSISEAIGIRKFIKKARIFKASAT